MTENSQHIGYKKCQNDRIVVLEILGNHNEEREVIVDKQFAKMRCAKAKVIRIYDMHDNSIEYKEAFGIHDETFRYEINKVVEPNEEFDENLNNVCASGIHYFLTEEPAYYWKYMPKNGTYKVWCDNGLMHMRCTFKNGNEDGLYEIWYSNGQMMKRCICKNGKFDGLCETWRNNGQMWERFTHKNGEFDGLYESWHRNGQMSERHTFKNGKYDGLFESWHNNGQILDRRIYKN